MCGGLFLLTRPRLIIDHENREVRAPEIIVSTVPTAVGGLCSRCNGGLRPPFQDEPEAAGKEGR